MAKKATKAAKRRPAPPGTRTALAAVESTAHPRRLTGRREDGQDWPQLAIEPWFWKVAVAVLAIGAALRLAQLAAPPFSHDESIHALFSYNFAAYDYNPIYHGPLLYHLVALTFATLGDSDYTARLVPSLCGIALLVLALVPARRWLGARASLWSAGLLAISPVMVTYSRRLLHDALVLALTIGAVLCLQAALENSSNTRAGRRARIGLAALLILFVATKANAFFIIGMLAAFWVAVQLRRLLHKKRRDKAIFARLPSWLPAAALLAVAVASYFALRDEPVRNRNEYLFSVVCTLAVLAVWVWLWLAPDDSCRFPAETAPTTDDTDGQSWRFDWITPLLAIAVALFLFAFLFGHGYLWWKNPGAALPRYWVEVKSAIPRMLEYWGGQQKKPRLPGRHDYYIVLMLLYELPIAVAALGGILRAGRQRSPFTDLLLWWAFTSFVLYALANEKVPWLLAHIMLPFILLAGWWLARLRFERPLARRSFALACGLGAVFLLRGVWAANFERAGDHHEPMFYAQTTESFRDAFFAALRQSKGKDAAIWVHKEKWWPPTWYLRRAPEQYGLEVLYDDMLPANKPLCMAVLTTELWQESPPAFDGWHTWTWLPDQGVARDVIDDDSAYPDFIIWPRASWPALQPDRFWRFWLTRRATEENGVLSEWSHSPAVVATAPATAM
jgi:uncharacterized protein (TIGR03663 family)